MPRGQIKRPALLCDCYLCFERIKDKVIDTVMSEKLDIKSKFAIGTAVVAFVVGFGLTIAGFLLPPKGEVHDSVLWILGQALIYTASVLGIGMYFNSKLTQLDIRTRQLIHEEINEEKGEA